MFCPVAECIVLQRLQTRSGNIALKQQGQTDAASMLRAGNFQQNVSVINFIAKNSITVIGLSSNASDNLDEGSHWHCTERAMFVMMKTSARRFCSPRGFA